MRLYRRDVLKSVLIGAPAAYTGFAFRAGAATHTPAMLLIDGIGPSARPAALFSFLDPIVSQNLPVGCVVRPVGDGGVRLEPDSELAAFLRRLSADYSGLVEILLDVPGLADAGPYFRARRASDAQTALRRALIAEGSAAVSPSGAVSLVTTPGAAGPVILDGLRGAGFRSALIAPQGDAVPEVWSNPDGVQQIFGGTRLAPGIDAGPAARALRTGAARRDLAVFYAGFPQGEVTDEALFDRGAALGDAFAAEVAEATIAMTLPSDLLLRSGEAYGRYLALCLDGSAPGGLSPGLSAFMAALDEAGIPFTLLTGPAPPGAATGHGLCLVPGPDGALAEGLEALAPAGGADCLAAAVTDGTPAEAEAAGAAMLVDLSQAAPARLGLDGRGLLRLPVALRLDGSSPLRTRDEAAGHLALALGARADALVLVTPGAVAGDTARASLTAALVAAAGQKANRFVTLGALDAAATPPDEPLTLLRTVRRHDALARAAPTSRTDRTGLEADAEIAWSYIARLTDAATGLAPSTAWSDDEAAVAYPFATMWDTASLLLGILSARRIGLIGHGEFVARAGRALGSIPENEILGLTLPMGFFATDGEGEGRRGYNASDVARFLIALRALQAYAPEDFAVGDLVARWDIAGTIRARRPHSIEAGRFVDRYGSNYAGYMARGFGLWGFEVAPPYGEATAENGTDRQVALLHAAARLGPVGTEPHVLEELELGFSDAARTLSDALFAAQLRASEATGKLVSVSEGPINRAPWFLYQGYQIDAVGEPWTVEALDPSPIYTTPGFLRATRMISTKSAYLWSAVKPGDYAAKLLAFVRERAPVEGFGFASGIFSVSGRPTENYSDINTNGVILQAIAYMLEPGRPAMTWRSGED